MKSVEPESSNLEHKEHSWWSSNWMIEAIAEEAETSIVVQLFLEMLEREHQCATVQDLSQSMRQSIEQDSVSAQLCVSSTKDSQEIGMSFARDVMVDTEGGLSLFLKLAVPLGKYTCVCSCRGHYHSWGRPSSVIHLIPHVCVYINKFS